MHGREWCRRKGYGLGNRGNVVWRKADWRDVRLRYPRDGRYDLRQASLANVLGSALFTRLDSRRGYLGVNDPLIGSWSDGSLNVYAGGVPIARLVDGNRDGLADAVFLTSW